MSTDTLERTDVDTTTDDGDTGDDVAHYYRKKDLERVISEFATITALCGLRGQPLTTGDTLPPCPKCKTIYDTLEKS